MPFVENAAPTQYESLVLEWIPRRSKAVVPDLLRRPTCEERVLRRLLERPRRRIRVRQAHLVSTCSIVRLAMVHKIVRVTNFLRSTRELKLRRVEGHHLAYAARRREAGMGSGVEGG